MKYEVYAEGTVDAIGKYDSVEALAKDMELDIAMVGDALRGDPCNDSEHDGYECYEVPDTDGGSLYVEIHEGGGRMKTEPITGAEIVEGVMSLRGSNDDIIAQAKARWGDTGCTAANLVCGLGAGSKRIQAGWIDKAGLDVEGLLKWAAQPYSSIGLHNAMQAALDWLAEQPEINPDLNPWD